MGAVVKRAVLAVVTAVVLAALVGVPRASAEALVPWWGVISGSQPTNLMPGQPGRIVVTAQNRGDGATSGEVTISDALPAGVEAVAIEGIAGEGTASSGPVSCTLQTLICTFSGSLPAYEEIEVDIAVSVHADAASGERNTASVSGGGVAGTVTASHPIEVDDTEKFGVEDYELIPENLDGSVDTQAGSHPFQLTTVMTFNSKTPDERGRPRTVALAKDIVAELPAGFLADPAPLAQCTDEQFSKQPPEQTGQNTVVNECPAQSAVGVATVTFNEPNVQGFNTVTTPIFNMTPLAGEPARFGFKPLGIIPAFLDASVRTGGDYGVTLTASDLTEVAWLLSVKLTFWGVPGARSHDGERGWECLKGFGTCPVATATGPPVLLTMPTSCEAPFQSTIRGDSWGSSARAAEQAEPVRYGLRGGPGESPSGEGESLSLDGCDQLPFAPSVEVSTDVSSASAPTGLTVDVHVPQPPAPTPESLAESSARDITLALPAGVTLNPAGANGLEACSESQIGFTGFGELDPTTEPSMRTALFTPALPEPLDPGLNFCPDASKVGTVKLQTPILPNALEGAVYLAAENANPYGSLAAIYIVARDPVSGTLVKLPGNLSLNQATGQITVMFEEVPQLPFEEIEMSFFGGERALLATPARCGSYTTDASFTPWSGNPPVAATSSFAITSGPNGGAGGSGSSGCPASPLPFTPSLAAGTTNINAGSFSPLTVTLGREDGQQALGGFDLRLPPGLEGMLSNVPLCPEAQANAGTCTSASQIGETTVSAGLGSDPYTVAGGRVYLTGPYEGAPFGLAIVTPVKAGPLDLENAPENHPACDCLVIRAKTEVDPRTAQLTIVTGAGADGIGAGGIPSIIDGVPLQIKHLNITIDRAGFIFNSTNCNKMAITSTVTSAEGAVATPSTSFQVANCKSLKFIPKLTASTEGHAEALKGGIGASLNVKIASRGGAGAGGEEANIKRVDLALPTLLPARLQPTLQNACTQARFAKDPASCPPDSFVGTATAVTPMLDAGLKGPAIFVSRGGAALPDLDLVLQGEGVEILLTGHTEIKGGVTYARFETFPDAPISSFALSLPQGPHSALASGLPTNEHSLCGQSLQMPATIEGQNGAVVKQTTKVKIQGCKPALYVRSTRVSGKSVTVTVTVPSAGKIVASGEGLHGQTKHPGGEKLVRLRLALSSAQAARVSKGHKLSTRVRLAFTPKRGGRLTKSVGVRFG